MRKVCVIAAMLSLVLASTAAMSQGGRPTIQSMKLIDKERGWASTDSSLFWTTDSGRHWKDITPKAGNGREIKSTFFLDGSGGWSLLVHEGENSGQPQFELASTTDAGETWSIGRLRLPHLDPERTTLSGGGRLTFFDHVHGWMNLDVLSSANFRLAILLATTDGGKTWDWAPGSPGISGEVRFSTQEDGWIAGGPGQQELYVTHDGSKTWQEVSFQTAPGSSMMYEQPPLFEDSSQGFLPVTVVGPEGGQSSLVLFATKDGGRTWKPERSMPVWDPSAAVPSTITDSTWLTASLSHANHLVLTTVGPEGTSAQVGAEVESREAVVLQLSFVNEKLGWALTFGGLFSTTDGGAKWVAITPQAPQSGTRLSRVTIR